MEWSVYFKKNLSGIKTYALAFLKWLILGVIIGILCGAIGAAFSLAISFVTNLRSQNGWILYLLPAGGLASVAIYKLLKTEGYGTNEVFEAVRSEKSLPLALMPAIFIASAITHLCGGSAGKEGAALQLGGGVSTFISRLLRLKEDTRHILTVCGMGALFSAAFGTPLGACVFALEVVHIGNFCSAAFFPAVISSVTAFFVSTGLGAEPERFSLTVVPELGIGVTAKVLIIAIVGAFVSIIFCRLLHLGEKLFAKAFKNAFLRTAVGGAVIILLTLLVGTKDYNGSGIFVIHRIFSGDSVASLAFLLKILFTVITVSAGFKGGEIVPTLFIGATLGAALSGILGIAPPFGAAVGMAALFCGVTNCPLATVILCIEMFGAKGMLFFALSGITSFLLSGMCGLYKSQQFTSTKLGAE